MSDESLPAAVRDFVSRYMDTVAQLEALLLFRSDPQRAWNVMEMAARLYAGERETERALERLAAEGFLILEEAKYRFQCRDATLEHMASEIATLHATHLIPLTNLIHKKPSRVREFADAFKFRKGS
ncbi:MAG TPA: hypothetical protein VMB71_00450 [Acetobacteraceae bacterium]|nr:hypothetical protein [Acetobacteraceae bacterium]